ncbi:MAG: MarR family winged helix-turn-helix transcriptional regulator [Acidobacteriota bacterium]|jgi:DNA-binding MarR family transcriptional regulator|nr:MarR family winged helix-turn-helix transcriptional regulator [Acidobacteriota bacterium]
MDQGITRRIMRCARQLEHLSGSGLSSQGLGSGRIRLLLAVLQNPGITQEQLSAHAAIDKTTTAKTVSRLEQFGYIQRHRDEKDLRLRRLFPTELALSLRADLERRGRMIEEILLRGFLETEITRLSGFLSRMLDNLARHGDQDDSGMNRPLSPATKWD